MTWIVVLAAIAAVLVVVQLRRYLQRRVFRAFEADNAEVSRVIVIPVPPKDGPDAVPLNLPDSVAADDPQLLDHIQNGRPLDAMVRYRELTGSSLKASKNTVERLQRNLKRSPDAG